LGGHSRSARPPLLSGVVQRHGIATAQGAVKTGEIEVSNQTFLYSTPGPMKPPYGECPPEGCVLMAAMSIPAFWYMLFDEGSLALGPDKENKGQSYLHLTTPTAEGLARAEDRWPAVCRVLGRNSAALFQTWLSFVRSKAKAYLHCETAEWFWMFKTHDEFE